MTNFKCARSRSHRFLDCDHLLCVGVGPFALARIANHGPGLDAEPVRVGRVEQAWPRSGLAGGTFEVALRAAQLSSSGVGRAKFSQTREAALASKRSLTMSSGRRISLTIDMALRSREPISLRPPL
jgi:hypothetical protein